MSEDKGVKKRVVVVGGGYAGVDIVKRVLHDLPDVNVTLVEPKDVFYHCIAAPRAAANADFIAKHVHWSFASSTWSSDPRLRFERQAAVRVNTEQQYVVLQNGVSIHFDVLVLAIGARNRGALKERRYWAPSALQDALTKRAMAVQKAKKVVVVGGGAVGVETAAEIASAHKGKEVLLVHNHVQLLESSNGPQYYPDKLHKKLMSKLAEIKNLELVLGDGVLREEKDEVEANPDDKLETDMDLDEDVEERAPDEEASSSTASAAAASSSSAAATADNDAAPVVDSLPDAAPAADVSRSTIYLKSGNKIADVDLVLWTIGMDFNESARLLAAFEVTRGGLKVNQHLQASGHENVFVAGDLADVPNERKLAVSAGEHAKLVASNVANLLQKKPLKDYVPNRRGPLDATHLIFLPLGEHRGVAIMPGPGKVLVGSTILHQTKGKDYLTAAMKSQLGFK